MARVLSFILILVSLMWCIPRQVHADDKQAELERSIEQLEKRRDAHRQPRRENSAPRSPRDNRFSAIKESLDQDRRVAKEENTPSPDGYLEGQSGRVTAHLRVRSGVEFPSADHVVLPSFPEVSPSLYMSMSEPARSETKPVTYERPARCEKNFTNRTLRYPESDDTTLIYEKIYLIQDLVPLDTIEVYGPKVRLVPYGGEDAESENRRMALDQVPCVPFRRRLTAAALYEDYGTAALKNYSQKPSGNGVMHVWVEQKLYGKR